MSIWYGRFSLPFHFEVAISGSNGRFSNLGFRDFFTSKFSVWNQHSFLPFQQQYFYAKKSLKPKKRSVYQYRRLCNFGVRIFLRQKISVWNQHTFLPFQWQYFDAKESLNQRLLNLTTEIATLKRNGREKRPYQNVFKSRKIKEQNFLLLNNQFWHKKVTHSQVAKSSDTGTEDKSVHLTSSPSEAGKI